MTLEQKIQLVERARAESIDFDDYFKELLGSGMSHAGAYNTAYVKLDAKPKSKPAPKAETKKPESPVKKTTTVKTEKVNVNSSKS